MTRRLDWAEFAASDFQTIDPERTIAVLPTAAVEQHGPHLPVGTDLMIATGMLERLRATCPDDLDLRILPVQAVGKSNEHLWAAGTLTLSAETALRAWTELGLSVARAGIRKMVIVNSHGGNVDLISILAREMRVQAGMLAVKCQWTGFGYPEGMISADERHYGIHGGEVETSLMLAFRPDLVAMDRAEAFASTAASAQVPPTGPVSYGWIARDLGEAGVVGNAAAATADKGHAIADHQVAGFVALLHAVRETTVPSAAATPHA